MADLNLPGIPDNLQSPSIPGLSDLFSGMPSLIVPKVYSIDDPSLKQAFDKLKEECIEKQEFWESRMTTFFGEYEEFTDNWRIMPRTSVNRPKALFNSV